MLGEDIVISAPCTSSCPCRKSRFHNYRSRRALTTNRDLPICPQFGGSGACSASMVCWDCRHSQELVQPAFRVKLHLDCALINSLDLYILWYGCGLMSLQFFLLFYSPVRHRPHDGHRGALERVSRGPDRALGLLVSVSAKSPPKVPVRGILFYFPARAESHRPKGSREH